VSTEGGTTRIRIGDPDIDTVTGRHTYTIRYTVRGALNAFDDHDELYWNAVGEGWDVPIAAASAAVTGPAPATGYTCFAGPAGSRLPCESARPGMSGPRASSVVFSHRGLGPREALSVVLAYPPGSVAGTAPILEERRDLATAFTVTPATAGAAGALGLLGIAGAALLAWRVGRDRRYAGQVPGLGPAPGQDGPEERVPLSGQGPVAVEFAPPPGLRPGQVGTLVDERAHAVDVTATIVDLAVRGHLHIAEVPRTGRWGPQDWLLSRRSDGDPAFLPYERRLFEALFRGRDEVLLSDLKGTFASELGAVQGALYADVVRQGWFRASPRATRAMAYSLAVLAVFAAIGVTVLLALFTRVALVGVGLVVAALAVLAVAGRMPARTGRGTAMLARVRGFEQYLSVAEAEQIRFEEREQVFSRYLPYAMVFGIAERWADAFRGLAVQRADGTSGLSWYTGMPGWHLGYFGASIGSFSTTTTGTLASTPASTGSSGFSSGGGFSGGGGGGGGGSSW